MVHKQMVLGFSSAIKQVIRVSSALKISFCIVILCS